jgi:hypothetical protein
MASGIRIEIYPGLYWKVRKIENRQMVMRGAGKKSVDSSPVLFYYFCRISFRGGDPGESTALFHTFEILKHRRPGSLGKALDSEAGQGWG